MGSSRRVAWLLFAVAWGTNHFVPLLVVYRMRLALSSLELASLFGIYAVGIVPGLLFGGPASDRWGRRTIVLPASLVALAGTCILFDGAAGLGVLAAGRFVVGCGAGATFSAGTAWVQDLAKGTAAGTGARRATVALSSGFGGGPLVTGVLAQWLPHPMELPYVVHGVLLTACILGAIFGAPAIVPESAPAPALAPASTPAPALAPAPAFPPGFFAVCVVAPWVFLLPSVSSAVLPALVRPKLGAFTVIFAGVMTGATLLSGVLVQPALRAWRPSNASRFGLAVGAAGLGCATLGAWTLEAPVMLLAALLLGVAYGGCLIAGLRFIETASTPRTRGLLTGIFYALTYVGFSWPLVLAALARRMGDLASLLVTLGLCVCALVFSAARAGDGTGGDESSG
jgi:MFS family permease